ncbi:MAG: hypothetical protein EOO73_28995 [Myxococcales bacterium]|nr:MAG: hypothetical protein EOO73_28995 [Myxococcales bacterium]
MFRPAAIAFPFALWCCVPSERPADQERAPARARSAKPRPALPPLEITGDESGPAAPDLLPTLTAPFRDDFERAEVGDDYFATGDHFHIEQGRLCAQGAHNHPLWLRHRLPRNARIQVEAEAATGDGDIKLEAWGDGQAAASRIAYTDATSYLAIFGGWKNRYHVLARLDEHAPDRPELRLVPGASDPRQQPVVKGRRYRLKVERTDGRTVRFWVDDVELLSLSDPLPLQGTGHDHFAFNDWETPVCFDRLVVEPLPS